MATKSNQSGVVFEALFEDYLRYRLGLPCTLPLVFQIGSMTVNRGQLFKLASLKYLDRVNHMVDVKASYVPLAKKLRNQYNANIHKYFNKLAHIDPRSKLAFIDTVPSATKVVDININVSDMEPCKDELPSIDGLEVRTITPAHCKHVFTHLTSEFDTLLKVNDFRVVLVGDSEFPQGFRTPLAPPVLFTNKKYSKLQDTMSLRLYPVKVKSKVVTMGDTIVLQNMDGTEKIALIDQEICTSISDKKYIPKFYEVTYKHDKAKKVIGLLMVILEADEVDMYEINHNTRNNKGK